MTKFFRRPWLPWVVVGTIVWWILAVIVQRNTDVSGLFAALAVAFFVLASLMAELLWKQRKADRERMLDDYEMQALHGIYAAIKPVTALPVMRLYALSPDLGLDYIRLIHRHKPGTVVELGSGVSTVLAAYQLRANGSGRVIAMDHQPVWAQRTRDVLVAHGLGENVEVRDAPLVTAKLSDGAVPWYDQKAFSDIDRIDMLLIDGPPDGLDRTMRRPALHLLAEKMSDDAVIVADDCHRPRWHAWLVDWAEKNGYEVEEPYVSEKGTLILRRKKGSAPGRP